MAAEITTNAASAQLSVPVTNGAASAAALRRVSAPHIPLMVVVTDVDGEKSDGIVATTTTAGALSLPACADDDAHSNHHHNHTSIVNDQITDCILFLSLFYPTLGHSKNIVTYK